MLQLQNITPGSGSAREMSAPLHHVSPTPKGQIGVTTIWGVFEMSSNPFLGMFSKCICHSHCLSHCFFCWSGHVFSSLWSNVSKVKSLKDRSLKAINVFAIVFVIVFVVVFLLFRSCFLITVMKCLKAFESKVKSFRDCSLKVFSKCSCNFHCHCLCLCLCLFVG